MKLYAISDLHLDHEENRRALERLPASPDDWLILAGDISHRVKDLDHALRLLRKRYARLIWVPGNHDLWSGGGPLSGEAKYRALVDVCHHHGTLTPEDPFVRWPGADEPCLIAPLFVLYDYSFRPDSVRDDQAIAWARAEGILCADERYLVPTPHASIAAWCDARVSYTEARLVAASAEASSMVLVNHWPLLQDLAVLPRIPRFTIWCGTRRTHDWHRRFKARVAVHGHLHIPRTQHRDGVRFEEVSFGYPKQRRGNHDLSRYLREILPGPQAPAP